MSGYDPNFLSKSIKINLPKPVGTLSNRILTDEDLRDHVYIDRIHYTVVMDRVRRAPMFAALNINQNQFQSFTAGDPWAFEPRIDENFQLGNEYYKGKTNPWDRGHVAMRANAAWGKNVAAARKASDDTYFYTNCALQHLNFNRDEWKKIEMWVRTQKLAKGGKVSSFSGPIYGPYNRTIEIGNLPTATAPGGFFKVICFLNKDGDLAVRAFVAWQDEKAIADRKGKKIYNGQTYQSTVAEIQELTGLKFDDIVAEKNPAVYKPATAAKLKEKKDVVISHLPERIEVNFPEEMLSDMEDTRKGYRDESVEVYLAGAMVNPKGHDTGKEWISIINMHSGEKNLAGWKLATWRLWDEKTGADVRELALSDLFPAEKLRLGPGEALRVQPVKPLRLYNTIGGGIALFDKDGAQIDRVSYTKKEAAKAGKAVVFFYPEPS